jgi:hypothetical protein
VHCRRNCKETTIDVVTLTPGDAAAVIEAVNLLRVANPSFGVRPLLAKLREQQPELGASRKEVREALRALGPLESEEEVVVVVAATASAKQRAGRKENKWRAATELWFSDGKISDASANHPPHSSTLPPEPHPAATALADGATSTLSITPDPPATVKTSTVASFTITTTGAAFTIAGAYSAAATPNSASPTTVTASLPEESRQIQGREGGTR